MTGLDPEQQQKKQRTCPSNKEIFAMWRGGGWLTRWLDAGCFLEKKKKKRVKNKNKENAARGSNWQARRRGA